MAMRRHISNREFGDLHAAVTNWGIARENQAVAVDRVIDILDCDADEAVDMLNRYTSGSELSDSLGLEVHRAELCEMPWVDGETLLVWGLILVGVVFAIGTSGITV